MVSLRSTEGIVCPRLWDLDFKADPYTLPFYRLFLSPTLTKLSLIYSSFCNQSPEEELSIIQPAIVGLDTFPLRDLRLQWFVHSDASRQMESVASSAVLRCGPALKKLYISSPFSDTAVQHIMQLPNLDTWYAMTGPPRIPDLSRSGIFSRLEHLWLVSESSLAWLTFFTTTARRTSLGQNPHTPSDHGPVPRLSNLRILPTVLIDAAFISPIILLRELTSLKLSSACSSRSTAAPICAFSLTDDNIAEVATALPHLEVAVLGIVCSANSCKTTVTSLVTFSTHCRNLERLEIHFNTTNLRNELESVSTDPRLESLPPLRTRDIFHLSLSSAPYTINEDDVIPVLKGFRRIFPSLTEIRGIGTSWVELNLRLQEL